MQVVTPVLIILVFISLSAVCSGLNLSLMSLELSDLTRKAKLGDRRAIRVLPLRRNAHLSLASILLTNVAVISTTSLFLDHLLGGLVAGVLSTLLIVIFGEIIPQAYFVARALTLTSLFAPLLRAMIIITYPVAKPLQLLLDRLFRHREPGLHTRQELGLIIAEHMDHDGSELDDDEVAIIRGALDLSEKRVRDITTPIQKVYWMTPTTVIDAAKIDEIKRENWSRIPIFDKQLTVCFGVLLMKQLVDIDFDERSYMVSELPLTPGRQVGQMTALDTALRQFIGSHTHLMAVEHGNKLVGVVTIEDIIEEIIGREIEDETDV
jgi:metal transporter CNNM